MVKTWLLKAAGLGNPAKATGLGNPDGQSHGQVNREVKAQEEPTARSRAQIKFHFPSEEFPVNPPLVLLGVFTSCRASVGSSL